MIAITLHETETLVALFGPGCFLIEQRDAMPGESGRFVGEEQFILPAQLFGDQ